MSSFDDTGYWELTFYRRTALGDPVAQGHPRALPVGKQAGDGVPGGTICPCWLGRGRQRRGREPRSTGAYKAGKAWKQILPQSPPEGARPWDTPTSAG